MPGLDRTTSFDAYWGGALADTRRLHVPAVPRVDLASPLLTESDVSATLRAMARTPHDAFIVDSLRAFSGQAKQPGIETTILHNPPPETGFAAWFYTVFPHGNVGLVLNRCERWNSDLGGRVASFLKPLELRFPGKIFEHELSFFIGDYSETPLGIHIDAEVDAFHYVLGPAARRLYAWPPDVYEAAKRPRMITEELLKSSSTCVYRIAPHQTFLLPAKRFYHVGANDGFTVSFAVAIFGRTPEEYQRSVGPRVGFGSEKAGWVPPRPVDATLTEYVIDGTAISELDRAYLRTRSNASLVNPPIPEVLGASVRLTDRFQRVTPFPIVWVATSGRIEVFARGQAFSVPERNWVRELLRRMNDVAPFGLGALLELEGVPNANVVSTFLSRLLDNGAMRLHNHVAER